MSLALGALVGSGAGLSPSGRKSRGGRTRQRIGAEEAAGHGAAQVAGAATGRQRRAAVGQQQLREVVEQRDNEVRRKAGGCRGWVVGHGCAVTAGPGGCAVAPAELRRSSSEQGGRGARGTLQAGARCGVAVAPWRQRAPAGARASRGEGTGLWEGGSASQGRGAAQHVSGGLRGSASGRRWLMSSGAAEAMRGRAREAVASGTRVRGCASEGGPGRRRRAGAAGGTDGVGRGRGRGLVLLGAQRGAQGARSTRAGTGGRRGEQGSGGRWGLTAGVGFGATGLEEEGEDNAAERKQAGEVALARSRRSGR
nr:fibroin heavy chain-like [Aegilops tauschii subsp. strangulata]